METVVETSIAVMIATARKHPNALTAMAHTQCFHATAKHGKKKRTFFQSNMKDQLPSTKHEKIVEEQLSAPGNSYASITKGAGVHVKCTDAQTQTDETYNVQTTSTASGGDPPPQRGQKAGGGPPPAHKTIAGDKPRPAPKPPSTLFESLIDGTAAGSSGRSKPTDQKNAPTQKIDTGRVSKGSDDPIKSHNVFGVLNEEGMEAETTPVSPRKGQIARLPIT